MVTEDNDKKSMSLPSLDFLEQFSIREIEEHKRYLLPLQTEALLCEAGFSVAKVKTFEFGLNQVAYGKK